MGRFDDVLRFWFDELQPRSWWNASIEVDRTIRSRFGALHEALTIDPPDLAALDAREHLGLVLVFDQFPRHLHRGSALAFASDRLALSTAEHAIDRGLDAPLSRPERQFLYMPLMHSEASQVQSRSLELFADLDDPLALRSARQHHDLIARFGRFPLRNAALGRPSTDDEKAYLAARAGSERDERSKR